MLLLSLVDIFDLSYELIDHPLLHPHVRVLGYCVVISHGVSLLHVNGLIILGKCL